MAEPVIRVRGLVNRFGDQLVHDHLDLDVRRGEILGVVGGSGAGKSVLMRSILGLRTPNAGEIEANRICYNALLTTAFEREQLILLLSNDKPLTSVREAWQAEQAENYDMEFSHTILRFCEDIRQAQQPEMTM